MDNKLSITGISLATLGVLISGLSIQHWSTNDGINTLLAPIYSKFTSLFFINKDQEAGFTSEGFVITEEFAIYLTMGVAGLFGFIAIVLALTALKKENISFVIASLLLGNSIFVLYNLKIALLILIVTGGYAIYLKYQLTMPSICQLVRCSFLCLNGTTLSTIKSPLETALCKSKLR